MWCSDSITVSGVILAAVTISCLPALWSVLVVRRVMISGFVGLGTASCGNVRIRSPLPEGMDLILPRCIRHFSETIESEMSVTGILSSTFGLHDVNVEQMLGKNRPDTRRADDDHSYKTSLL